MATSHVVTQGEHLSQIAKRYGFRDSRTVWDHPDNAALRERRPSPNVLLPGDVIQIPAKRLGRLPCATHRFQIPASRCSCAWPCGMSNLGYITRPPEEVDAILLTHAVLECQCDVELPVMGVWGAATQAKLKELHGD